MYVSRGKFDEVEKNVLDDIKELIKHHENTVTNNQFFDEWGSKKNPPRGRCMKNLRRNNGLYYFKQMQLYIHVEELKERLFCEFYYTPLPRHKEVCAMMAEF